MRTVPDDHYRLVGVRPGHVADARDLLSPLDALLAALAEKDASVFHLSGLTPAYETRPVKDGREDNLQRFLATAELDYPFGRGADEPTHGVRFFNTREASDEFADLSLSWFDRPAGRAGEATAPTLVATLRLGTRAAQPSTGTRGQHLDEVLGLLVRALQPQFGFVDLPRPLAPAPPRPSAPLFRWATYFSHPYFNAWRPTPETLPPTATLSVIDGHGITLLATAALDAQVSSDVARAVDALERVVRPALLPEDAAPTPAPAAPVPTQTTVPSYLRQHAPPDSSAGGRPVAAPTPFEDSPTEAMRPDPNLSPALPFRGPTPGSAGPPLVSGADGPEPTAAAVPTVRSDAPTPFTETTTEALDPADRVAPALPFDEQGTEAPKPSKEPVTPFEKSPPRKKP